MCKRIYYKYLIQFSQMAQLMNNAKIMGILNTTPDSLFGGTLEVSDGHYKRRLKEIVEKMVRDGAHIIDIGGESTGPGSEDVSVEDEWRRIEPALAVCQELRRGGLEFEVSVDTYKADVFERALIYGVDILNDVTALRGDTRMVEVVAKAGAKVCLMYSAVLLSAEGNLVRTNTEKLQYENVLGTIGDFLEERIEFVLNAGVKRKNIILDPGMGAFISGDHKYSYDVIQRLAELKARFQEYPILIGASRKAFTGLTPFGTVLPVEERLVGSLNAAMTAVENGASIVRVHDIEETKYVLR